MSDDLPEEERAELPPNLEATVAHVHEASLEKDHTKALGYLQAAERYLQAEIRRRIYAGANY